jgi:predicted O-methyltransferase YrrM
MLEPVSKSELDIVPVNWLGLHRQYLNDGEMEIIVALVRGAQSMLEIGCRDGRTARVILHNTPSLVRYVGIDVTPDYIPSLWHQRSEMVEHPGHLALGDPRFEVIVREQGSRDLSPQHFMAFDHGPFDAAFIDGDHYEQMVMHDGWLAREIVRPGGVIIFHDYCNAGVEVQRALDRLHGAGWPLKHIEGTWLAYMHRS